MFIEIKNKDMDAFKVEKLINETRDANGGVFSPEFAMEILGKTNHFAHIKKVINNIKKVCSDKDGKLVADKVLAYKDFILSSVDGREQEGMALKWLQELADACGIREEFDKVNDERSKIYNNTVCKMVVVKTKEEFKALKGNNLVVYHDFSGKKVLHTVNDDYYTTFYADDSSIDLSGCDLNKVERIIFREGAEVNLSDAKNLPKELDFSMCDKVDLRRCDLSGVKELKFGKETDDCCGPEIDLRGASNLPEYLDIPAFAGVDFGSCDLSRAKELKFGEGVKVSFWSWPPKTILPENLDVSMCSYVNMEDCDLSGVKELKFDRETATVNLKGCDLSGIKELKFREGAVVDLFCTRNLPEVLDLSMCSDVNLSGCDLSGVKNIRFKDRKQKREFMKGAKNFKGKIKYEQTEMIVASIKQKFDISKM